MLAPRTVRPHTAYELMVSNLGAGTEQFMYEIVTANDTVVGATSVEVKPKELRKVEVSVSVLNEELNSSLRSVIHDYLLPVIA